MTMPGWWSERRFGVFVHATPASVPAWAPIGADASEYQRLMGETPARSLLPTPSVEVFAHHRDRWGHVESFDDFVPLLTYEHFDAEAWAQLASDAGASYTVAVAKHHDGWTWWDAPGSTRPLTEDGPHRDVLAEYAAACERHGIAFGTSYSFADGSITHSHILDLVERHGSVLLCGTGPVDDDDSDISALFERVHEIDPDAVIDDGWPCADGRSEGRPPRVQTFHGEPPDDIIDGPWQLVRGLGPSLGYNRAERDEHRLTEREIVELYTEVVAKGGNLLLAVGPDAAGIIPTAQAEPVRGAGRWIRHHGPVLARTTPWIMWGDSSVRYLADGDGVLAIDIEGTADFAELHTSAWRVGSVELVGDDEEGGGTELSWRQDADGLHVERSLGIDHGGVDIPIYRISLDVAERPDELFESTATTPIAIAPLLTDATAGAIVQLGDGVYVGPVEVPPGVVLRGLGPSRTTISVDVPDAEDTPRPTIEVGARSRLEHLRVTSRTSPAVVVSGDSATLLGCSVAGVIEVRADDVLLRAVTARGLIGVNADRLHVSRSNFDGDRDEVGIDLRGGGGHVIESTRLSGHRCAIRLSETTGSNLHGNTIRGRWWGIHLDHCENAHVHGNRITWSMRAVDVDGGTQAIVDGNAVTDGDSGCIVQDGASDCEVYGNHWDRCRIGLLTWEAVALHHQDNIASSLHEPDGALVTGP